LKDVGLSFLKLNFRLQLVAGYWILDTGVWLLDTGYWLLVAGYCLFCRNFPSFFFKEGWTEPQSFIVIQFYFQAGVVVRILNKPSILKLESEFRTQNPKPETSEP